MEILKAIVERVTFYSEESGWSVLKVAPLERNQDIVPVTVFQAKVFAGATVDFHGEWVHHPKYGKQFKAYKLIEKKPSSVTALEKYLGSGLIKGVGPKTAKRIVSQFGKRTLEVFESSIEELLEVDGIARKKLKGIVEAWDEHKEIRNVMIFLQSHGVSTLHSVKIFKKYGEKSIEVVTNDPYQLARDIFGIGFLSSDKIALNIGFKEDDPRRVRAAVLHVLSGSKDEGHCYLTHEQISEATEKLIGYSNEEGLGKVLDTLSKEDFLKIRSLENEKTAYYSKRLFFDETFVAKIINSFIKQSVEINNTKTSNWLETYNKKQPFPLSNQQIECIKGIVASPFSILTGGPGCGKTTTTKTVVNFLLDLGKHVTLVAPTGRAAQRMGEVIGLSAKTIHRLLVFQAKTGQFKFNENNQLSTHFVIVDECSMLDISLAASLLKAIPKQAQVLFIGDKDQLPSVGAGSVLSDLLSSKNVPSFNLTQVFRQAKESLIIKYAHIINAGYTPRVESPVNRPSSWKDGTDALFIDAEEATVEQLNFLKKIKSTLKNSNLDYNELIIERKTAKKKKDYFQKIEKKFQSLEIKDIEDFVETDEKKNFLIPSKFSHVDLQKVLNSDNSTQQLTSIIKKIHPWSMLHYGLSAMDSILRIYLDSIPKYVGESFEIQILSPMTRGSMGTINLNSQIQRFKNPWSEDKPEIKLGEKVFRIGDRVIQKRNNYDLEVFNGDIGTIAKVSPSEMKLAIHYKAGESVREVIYQKENLIELDLSYAITIHKSQGSEFDIVIIPVFTQHFKMLYRNLLYTGLTRAKKFVIFVGTRKALTMGVKNVDNRERQTCLTDLIK